MQRVVIAGGGGRGQGEAQFGADTLWQLDGGFRGFGSVGCKPGEHFRAGDRFLRGEGRDRDASLLLRPQHEPVRRRQDRAEIDRVDHGVGDGLRVRLEGRTLDLPAGLLGSLTFLVLCQQHQFLRRGRGGECQAGGEG